MIIGLKVIKKGNLYILRKCCSKTVPSSVKDLL